MFKTGIVLHYVSEYSKKEQQKIFKEIQSKISDSTLLPKLSSENNFLSAINFIKQIPVGSVIVKNLSGNTNQTVICFPMFSSHITLPVKPGEEIWYFNDTVNDFSKNYESGAPLLSSKNYWISRKIGAKISEDLNYTHMQRNSLISNVRSDVGLSRGQIRIPSYESSKLYKQRYKNILPEVSTLYNKAKQSKLIYPNAVPRYNSSPYELTLQGSNNSLINLTKNKITDNEEKTGKGAIDLVAGRHTLQDYTTSPAKSLNQFAYLKDDIQNVNFDSKENIFKSSIIYFSDKLLQIYNSFGDLETLKDPEYYINHIGDQKKEGEVDFNKDASRIYISEFDKVDNSDFVDTNFLNRQKVINTSEIVTTTLQKNYFLKEKPEESLKLVIENNKSSFLDLQNKALPTIYMKTNNLRLVARKGTENNFENKTLDEGSIRLIKESNNFQNYSHLLLEENGDVLVDGKTIYIGNFQKELYRNNIIKSHIETKSRKNLKGEDLNKFEEDLDKMKGKGSGVLIGYDPEHSEPLVLGETLKTIISELINVNILLTDELKILSKALQNHKHIGIPGSGVSGIPQDFMPYEDFQSEKHKNVVDKYKNIKDNLKDILSKFAKTS